MDCVFSKSPSTAPVICEKEAIVQPSLLPTSTKKGKNQLSVMVEQIEKLIPKGTNKDADKKERETGYREGEKSIERGGERRGPAREGERLIGAEREKPRERGDIFSRRVSFGIFKYLFIRRCSHLRRLAIRRR